MVTDRAGLKEPPASATEPCRRSFERLLPHTYGNTSTIDLRQPASMFLIFV